MTLEPKPIRKLKEEVINRIAAGEIIQRPANALKELIENSLDAESTNIQITVKNGGLRLLQIQDNGTGIRKDDFEIVCERFTTSKLREFDDLQKIATYGFRGEALASISHVAHLTIVSKTKKDICAYQADFCDGKLKAPAKPLAGNQGTIITVEDLFYNMNVRKKALRSPAEEYQKISDVVSKYSIHNASVGFALKKHGGNNDIRTPVNSGHSENIRLIYGSSIARELIEFQLENDRLQFQAKGYMTNVNYSTKKFQFLLFINHRLVDCQSLKKCIDTVYQTYLPKNAHPFVYLSLELEPNNVDVNVHPTKHEVHFLNESQIIESITTAVEQKLLGSNSSRVFYTQSKLPNLQFETKETLRDKSKKSSEPSKYVVRTDSNVQKLDKFFNVDEQKNKVYKNHKKDKEKPDLNMSLTEEEYQKHHEQFLIDQENLENKCLEETMEENSIIIEDSPKETIKDFSNVEQMICDNIESPPKKIKNGNKNGNSNINLEADNNTPRLESIIETVTNALGENYIEPEVEKLTTTKEDYYLSQEAKKCEQPLSKHLIKKITRVETKLTSILQLRKSVEEDCHRTLRETFAQHVFVGPISPKQSLIQYGTQLLLCNTKMILEELFYQLILYNFQNFGYYRLSEPMPIKDLALLGLDLPETGWTEDDGAKEELAEKINEILIEKRPMLNEYFSIDIDEEGKLKALPIILENYIPDPLSLPLYLIRLATEVNWEKEQECFKTFSRETAVFYSNVSKETDENGKSWKWVTEHLLYPAIKEFFIPPKCFTENAAILEIASLPNLYKVFERC